MPIAHLDKDRIAQAAPSALLEATVSNPALNPDGWLRVEVDNQPGPVRLCPWDPRVDLTPEPGDAVVVMESDEGNYWALVWWSQSGTEPTPPGGALPPLGSGQSWVGASTVPTDIATQAELDAEAAARIAADATKAPLASPVFTGNPTAPTPSPGDNDTSIATTAYVTAAVAAGGGGGGTSRAFAIAMAG